MKTVTSTEANRSFSKLLNSAARGITTAITVRGRIIAKITPANDERDHCAAEARKREHVAQLLSRPAGNVSLGRRDELYEDQ